MSEVPMIPAYWEHKLSCLEGPSSWYKLKEKNLIFAPSCPVFLATGSLYLYSQFFYVQLLISLLGKYCSLSMSLCRSGDAEAPHAFLRSSFVSLPY